MRTGSDQHGFEATIKPGLHHVSLGFNETYVKMYIDGKRVGLDTDGLVRPAKVSGICLEDEGKNKAILTNFRLAEGGKDYATELTTGGRIVTHGITFDTGSDVLKPESSPTLRKILKVLQDNADIKFEIQGHTGDQGSDKVNGPLSGKRAAAVKAWFVKQGIEDARLTTQGLGATKPIDSNETPEGKANNRRVEFVKI